MVIAIGTVASHEAVRIDSPRIPVIASTVIDADLQQLPRKDGASGKRNVTYLDERYSVRRTIQQFQDITSFRNLAGCRCGVCDPAAAPRTRRVRGIGGGNLLYAIFVKDLELVKWESGPAGAHESSHEQ